MIWCGVNGCRYTAEGDLGGFPVCVLHDGPQTLGILERLELPGSFWAHNRPIVLPCGELKEKHFVHRQAPSDVISACDDPLLVGVPTESTKQIHPNFDLTRR